MLGMLINREHGVIWAARRVCVCKDNCWPKIILNGDMNGRDGCINIEYTGEFNNFIVCYDLVKIWKEPFENPYKLGAKYEVDGETTWHKIDGDVHRMDVKQGTWLVGVQFAKYDNSSNATNGRLYWPWEKNKEYAECYNLAETEKKIELRNQRDGSGKFSISIAQHDMLRTLDGYDDSGN